MRLRRRDHDDDLDGAEAARVAMYDDVTGLASRYLFFDRLGLALARTERRNSWAAVLLLDLDGFPASRSAPAARPRRRRCGRSRTA
jgi:GGDEF domain-containing protein